jgi:hypothetical protein
MELERFKDSLAQYIVFGGYPNTKKNNSFNLDIYIKIKRLKAILKIYL